MFLDIVFIIILVFVIQYYILSIIKTNSLFNVTSSLNKMYLGIIRILTYTYKNKIGTTDILFT